MSARALVQTAWLGAAASVATAAERDASELLISTEWHWNSWRNVKFHAPRRDAIHAKFSAPTEDCESGRCSWHANTSGVFIAWGDAGLHTLTLRGLTTLVGTRHLDGESCEATLVGSFAEELLDLDLYAILRVGPDARTAEIKRAFRRLSLESHPDKAAAADGARVAATEQFVTLRGAFEVLSDAAQRAAYDERCAQAEAAFVAPPAVTTFAPADFAEAVERRGEGERPWLVLFTMSPDSPCAPCHQLRPIVREAAEPMRAHVRVGVLHCDVAAIKPTCQAQMEGRGYYPVVKVYAAPGVQKILDLEPQQPTLPSGTIVKLMAALVEVLATARRPAKRFWAAPPAH